MKTKFNKFERIAGLFVATALLGSAAIALGVMVKKGFLEEKLHLATELRSADGVHEGTQVQMAGLRAGSVTEVKLIATDRILVKFDIGEAYRDRVRDVSVVTLTRPFIIGEKVLDVSVGGDGDRRVADNAILKSEETVDLMDLASGRKLGAYLASMSAITENAKFIVEQILNPKRSKNILKMFDDMQPLVRNVVGISGETNSLLHQLNQKKQLVHLVDNMAQMSDEVNLMLPEFRKQSPQMAQDLAKITKSMAVLSAQLEKTLPLLNEIGPELPHAARRAFEALDETVVTLKALQKSFLMRGNVKEVLAEEKARDESAKKREPATAEPSEGAKQDPKP